MMGLAPNGLPFSCAAPIDRSDVRALSGAKKAPISIDAQRRQLQWRVGPPAGCVS
jgi:hypothetical protein